jgi:hypothetical protein
VAFVGILEALEGLIRKRTRYLKLAIEIIFDFPK